MIPIKQYGSRPTRAGFGEGILEAGLKNEKLVVLGADITASVGLDLFAARFPERFFSLGIAEQNCAGVAAGLALGGMIPVFSTYGVFAALRAADQIRVSLCYNRLPCIIGGAHAGISVGPDGATHQALEDIAIMRVLPGMKVISPCDASQAKLLTLDAIKQIEGPVYIRFGREPVADFSGTLPLPERNLVQPVLDGSEICIMATGHMVWEAYQAALLLHNDGIAARVINVHTIKPIDAAGIVQHARETRMVVTVEEHQVAAGFGSAVAEVLAANHPLPLMMIGVNDRFGESGPAQVLLKEFGLDSAGIYRKIKEFYECKQCC